MKSKAIATWLGVAGGWLGAHRFYLHGPRDRIGWLHPLPALLGGVGVWRMRAAGLDDAVGNGLAPLLGLMLAIGTLQAIVIGLTPAERWRERFGAAADGRSGWATTIGVALSLGLGAIAAMATIAFVAQRLFERLAGLPSAP